MSFDDQTVSPEKRSGFSFRGREITLSKTKGRPMTGIKKKHGYYDDTKRIEVATIFAVTGDPDKTCELTKVPVGTIRSWRKTEWFKTLLEEIRDENNEKLDGKFTEIVHKSQELLVDRLENGDWVLQKDGTLVRRPVSSRDLALVGAITVDKRQVIRKLPTSITQNQNSGELSDEKLQKLAEVFKDLTKKLEQKQPQVITDVEFTEVPQGEEVPPKGE